MRAALMPFSGGRDVYDTVMPGTLPTMRVELCCSRLNPYAGLSYTMWRAHICDSLRCIEAPTLRCASLAALWVKNRSLDW